MAGSLMRRLLVKVLLLCVPLPWRDAVHRDLREENAAGTRFAIHAVTIGMRLRLAHAADRATGLARMPAGRFRMNDFGRDLILAVRTARRRPGYAVAVIATLAIGIGANTAIYSVFNWILLRPLPHVVNPGELVTVRYQSPRSGDAQFWVSYADYADLRDSISAFSSFAAAERRKMDVRTGSDAELLSAEIVTTNYLSLFGVTPVLGRDFRTAEERPGDTVPPAIISNGLWRRAFSSDPAVLGKEIRLDGRSFTVVGVAPNGFQGRSIVGVTDVWIPVGAYPVLQPQVAATLYTRRSQTLFGDSFGRLAPGATLAQAQEQATAVASTRPMAGRQPRDPRHAILPVLTAGIDHGPFTEKRLRTVFSLLMGAVGLVLLLACANAGNLLLARALNRRREIAVCLAIGASRFRIVRQQLAEALVLSVAAGTAGLLLAVWLTSLFDGMRIVPWLPAVADVSVDWRVCAFALAASVVTAVLFATVPSIVGTRVELQSSLKDGVTSSRGSRRVLRGGLVVLQVAVSVLLLAAAGLFMRTLHNLRTVDLGLEVEGVVSASVDPGRYGYSAERGQRYVADLLDRLRTAPGVESAAYTWTTPYGSWRADVDFLPTDGTPVGAATTGISPGFFRTMRIPLLAGRDFTPRDIADQTDASGTVIITRSLARRLFPSENPVGSRIELSDPKGKIVEIVGIVEDVRAEPLTSDPLPWAYMPMDKGWGTVVVRSGLPAAEAVATVRQVARAVDPVVTPHDIEPFTAVLDRLLSEQRVFAKFTGVFAAIAALVATVGIYGMLASAVSERRKEFGIRLALGARAASVLRLVLRSSLVLAAMGALLGLAAAAGLRQVVESRLYGVSGLDPLTLTSTVMAIMLLSIAASLPPALRASRVDPVRSLRLE